MVQRWEETSPAFICAFSGEYRRCRAPNYRYVGPKTEKARTPRHERFNKFPEQRIFYNMFLILSPCSS
jgi:hypothetical protein